VHGANRLGTNSLTDLLVFGKSAGDSLVDFVKKTAAHKPLRKMPAISHRPGLPDWKIKRR